jgi:hypothetical protein
MAKSYHLKEITDYETDNAGAKPYGNRKGNDFQTKAARLASPSEFLDELTLWKTALQIEILSK